MADVTFQSLWSTVVAILLLYLWIVFLRYIHSICYKPAGEPVSLIGVPDPTTDDLFQNTLVAICQVVKTKS